VSSSLALSYWQKSVMLQSWSPEAHTGQGNIMNLFDKKTLDKIEKLEKKKKYREVKNVSCHNYKRKLSITTCFH